MRGQEQNKYSWGEMSWHKYHINGRKYWYEEENEEEYNNILSYGLLEDLTITCCYGIEDWFDIVEEFN